MMSKKFSILILVLLIIVVPAAHSQDFDNFNSEEDLARRQEAVQRQMEQNRKKIASRFRGYGRYAKYFRSLCRSMRLDGRDDFFYQLGDENDVKTEDCIACKSFYKVLAKSCKPKKLRSYKDRKKEDKPQKIVKQRYPHITVSYAASALGEALSEDLKDKEVHYRMLGRFRETLKSSKAASPAVKEYGDMVIDTIMAHFADYAYSLKMQERKEQNQERGIGFQEREMQQLRELFGYE